MRTSTSSSWEKKDPAKETEKYWEKARKVWLTEAERRAYFKEEEKGNSECC